MKTNKKLTLKSIQDQLDLYKTKINSKIIKQPNLRTNFLKSSFLVFYLLSWVGFIFSKLPFLSKFSKPIKFILGKTVFWTFLVYCRKAFIVMNAIIGIWLMFKITGWNQGSFFMSAAAIGGSYMEFFVSFVYKAYNWLFNLLDNKVVPNIPNNWSGSQFNGWNTEPMKSNKYLEIANNAKSWYQPMHPASVSSWSDWLPSWSTLFYLGIGLLTIGALYSGYIYFSDFIHTAFGNIDKGKGPEINVESPGVAFG